MKSFALLRTNVSLTTNYKIMVTSKYGLYFDSIDSLPDLSVKNLKKIQINKDNALEYILPNFWSKTPFEIAYYVKENDDADIMYSDFSNQYDPIYHCGARNISNNKDYDEEFEYFAPIHITKNYLPRYFIIFRVDGPGLSKLTRKEFRQQILDRMKCIKIFDLTRSSDLGIFLNQSITNNNRFPNSVCDIDFQDLYSSISGIKYPVKSKESGFVDQSFFCDFRNELTFSDMQKYITERFRVNHVIYPHILNLSFLFDDTPATPTSLRKWSLNRYIGFYFDQMDLVTTVSPTRLYTLKNDVFIDKSNFLVSMSGGSPFLDETSVDVTNLYINVNKNIYKIVEVVDLSTIGKERISINSNTFVDQFVRKSVKKYKILSDSKLYLYSVSTDSLMNQVVVKYENGENLIYLSNGDPFVIDNFDDSDMWLIKIGQDFFKLAKNVNGLLIIYTDHAFEQTDTKFEYYINDPDVNYRKTYNISLKEVKEPLKFYIYKCKFTDIKDFDNDFVETEFAKFEYDDDDGLTISDEPKLYVNNKKTGSVDDFKFGSDVVNIPVSSEYTANDETFRVSMISKGQFKLNSLWKKNPDFVKWGYKNSLCSNHYPYLLNNSIAADPFNRSTNFYEPKPVRAEKNLDYFYTINSDGQNYSHHSLHIEDRVGNSINRDFKFEIDKYLGIDGHDKDYFTYFFGKRDEYQKGNSKKNIKKWSNFIGGQYETNSTVFKGLKLLMYEVIDSSDMSKISFTNTQKLTDYKFAILLSQNEYGVSTDPKDPNLALIEKRINTLKWIIIKPWKSGQSYIAGEIIIWNDVIYKAKINNVTTLPKNPITSNDNWEIYQDELTIYSGLTLGSNLEIFGAAFSGRSIVFNSGQYYQLNPSGTNGDFWIDGFGYNAGQIVLFKGQFYICLRPNSVSPRNTDYWAEYILRKPQEKIDFHQTAIWWPVAEWRRGRNYNESAADEPFAAVTHENVLYITSKLINNSILPPKSDRSWIRVHSFVSNSQTIYGPSINQNNIVRINEQLYLCVDNTAPVDNVKIDNTLDDGINIYINRKYKNVLVNIYVNDNTFANAKLNLADWEFYDNLISNTNRDKLYTSLLYKFTASNFLNSLTMPDKSFGFSDKIRYIIVNEDSTINIYDFNVPESIKKLPFILRGHFSNQIPVRIGQIESKPVEVDQNILKPTFALDDGLLTTRGTINHYSDLPVANMVEYKDPMTKARPLSQAQKEVILYRHNGSYSPIFKEIQLFKADTVDKSYDNYKFDTDLTEFGMTGEHLISKVNRNGSQLKLKNSKKFRSIYPMLDEVGYQVVKRFIFKSSWDLDYYFECSVVSRTDNQRSITNISNQTSVAISEDRILTIRKCN